MSLFFTPELHKEQAFEKCDGANRCKNHNRVVKKRNMKFEMLYQHC